MSLTVACVLRSGGVYSISWVERLSRQVRRHLGVPLTCLSDATPLEIGNHPGFSLEIHSVRWEPLMHCWPGWWSKLELFRPGLFSGPVVYFDLDTAIVGPIPALESQIAHHGGLWMLSDFYAPQRPASGVMAWIPSPETERIYHDFARDPAAGMQTRFGDGGFIGRYPHGRLQTLFPGVFASYKAQHLDRGPAGYRVICLHGRPKFPDFPREHWMRRAWEGSTAP